MNSLAHVASRFAAAPLRVPGRHLLLMEGGHSRLHQHVRIPSPAPRQPRALDELVRTTRRRDHVGTCGKPKE